MTTRSLLLPLLAIALFGCGAGAGAGGSAAVAATTPTPAATVTPVATVAVTPSPTADTAIVRRIVQRLDDLALLAATGDGDMSGTWANDEGEWLTGNFVAVAETIGLETYSESVLGLLTAVAAGSDQTDAVGVLLALRDPLAATVGMSASVAVPTPEPTATPAKVGSRLVFTSTDDDSNALYLTIVRVQTWRSTNQFLDPAAGNKFVTADVLFQGKAGEIDARAGEFTITDADGYVYDIAPMWRETSLPYDISLKKGKKVRGWLTFEVPKTLKKGWIVYAESLISFTVK